jgi:hypothetical protein
VFLKNKKSPSYIMKSFPYLYLSVYYLIFMVLGVAVAALADEAAGVLIASNVSCELYDDGAWS